MLVTPPKGRHSLFAVVDDPNAAEHGYGERDAGNHEDGESDTHGCIVAAGRRLGDLRVQPSRKQIGQVATDAQMVYSCDDEIGV